MRSVTNRVTYRGAERSRDVCQGGCKALELKQQKVMVAVKRSITRKSEGSMAVPDLSSGWLCREGGQRSRTVTFDEEMRLTRAQLQKEN